jgi:hypothetical protein
MERFRLLVTMDSVGIVVDTTMPDAAKQVKKAREHLRNLAGTDSAPRARAKGSALLKTLSERILGLGPQFFNEPIESRVIAKQLARAGFHYRPAPVRVELRRLVRRGKLRRLGGGTKSDPYRYVNP